MHLEMTEGIGNKRKNQYYMDRSIKISSNTEKSPGDLRRLDVTQPPVKDHELQQQTKN